jgi:hypothetical protein
MVGRPTRERSEASDCLARELRVAELKRAELATEAEGPEVEEPEDWAPDLALRSDFIRESRCAVDVDIEGICIGGNASTEVSFCFSADERVYEPKSGHKTFKKMKEYFSPSPAHEN